jgi:hypothetical protein
MFSAREAHSEHLARRRCRDAGKIDRTRLPLPTSWSGRSRWCQSAQGGALRGISRPSCRHDPVVVGEIAIRGVGIVSSMLVRPVGVQGTIPSAAIDLFKLSRKSRTVRAQTCSRSAHAGFDLPLSRMQSLGAEPNRAALEDDPDRWKSYQTRA